MNEHSVLETSELKKYLEEKNKSTKLQATTKVSPLPVVHKSLSNELKIIPDANRDTLNS